MTTILSCDGWESHRSYTGDTMVSISDVSNIMCRASRLLDRCCKMREWRMGKITDEGKCAKPWQEARDVHDAAAGLRVNIILICRVSSGSQNRHKMIIRPPVVV